MLSFTWGFPEDHGSPSNLGIEILYDRNISSHLYTFGHPCFSQHQLVSSSSTTLNICLGLCPRVLTGTYSTTPFILGAFPGEFFKSQDIFLCYSQAFTWTMYSETRNILLPFILFLSLSFSLPHFPCEKQSWVLNPSIFLAPVGMVQASPSSLK